MNKQIKSIVFLVGFTILFFFSLLELYNLGSLYKDQVEMWEFSISTRSEKVSSEELTKLSNLKWEFNILISLCYLIIFLYVGYTIRRIYKVIRKG